MKKLCTLFLISYFCLGFTTASETQPYEGVLSFKEWKSQQVQGAISKVTKLRSEMELTKDGVRQKLARQSTTIFAEVLTDETSGVSVVNPQNSADAKLEPPQDRKDRTPDVADTAGVVDTPSKKPATLDTLETQLTQAQLRLETANSLSLIDYLDIYVLKSPDKQEFFKALAKKMTTEEVAGVLRAYYQKTNGVQSPTGPSAEKAMTRKFLPSSVDSN